MKILSPILAAVLVALFSAVWTFALLLGMNGVSERQGTVALALYAFVVVAAVLGAFVISRRIAGRVSPGWALVSALLVSAGVSVALAILSIGGMLAAMAIV